MGYPFALCFLFCVFDSLDLFLTDFQPTHFHHPLILYHIPLLYAILFEISIRRFILRGSVKVEAEWLLYSLALNILRLHHKIQNNRLGNGLVIPKAIPAGL